VQNEPVVIQMGRSKVICHYKGAGFLNSLIVQKKKIVLSVVRLAACFNAKLSYLLIKIESARSGFI
jgi:hypothetical protein